MMKRSNLIIVLAALLCAAGLLWLVEFRTPDEPAAATATPVQAAAATRRDMPVYLSNIGTVQPFNMVLIRPRVDGQISRVAFDEGTQVKQGDVLVELDRRPFEAQWRAAVAQKERDQAQLENAKRDQARYQSLVNDDAGAIQTLDTTRAQVAQLTAALSLDQAQVDYAHLQLTFTTITAPIDGRTGARLVDVGNLVHANDTTGLVVLTQLHPIAVNFSLPQATLDSVRAAQSQHPLRVLAMDATGEKILGTGELTLIDNQIDATTGTYKCKAIFTNDAESLWPGQFVTVRVQRETLPQAVVVPSLAVQTGPRGAYVYVVSPKNEAELRDVQIAQTINGETVITAGLSGTELVITEGQFHLEPGDKVTVVKPAPAATAATQAATLATNPTATAVAQTATAATNPTAATDPTATTAAAAANTTANAAAQAATAATNATASAFTETSRPESNAPATGRLAAAPAH